MHVVVLLEDAGTLRVNKAVLTTIRSKFESHSQLDPGSTRVCLCLAPGFQLPPTVLQTSRRGKSMIANPSIVRRSSKTIFFFQQRPATVHRSHLRTDLKKERHLPSRRRQHGQSCSRETPAADIKDRPSSDPSDGAMKRATTLVSGY